MKPKGVPNLARDEENLVAQDIAVANCINRI
jgi:hypothetical protein